MVGILTRIVIFDQGMYHGNGLVRKWMDQVTLSFEGHAKIKAPVHTGQLKAGIHASVAQVGPRQIEGIIESSAPHTMYVLRGTTGPIMANRAWNTIGATGLSFNQIAYTNKRGKDGTVTAIPRRGMFLKFEGYDGRSHFAGSVSGQDANNFLLKAWNATARSHRAIRRYTGPMF